MLTQRFSVKARTQHYNKFVVGSVSDINGRYQLTTVHKEIKLRRLSYQTSLCKVTQHDVL